MLLLAGCATQPPTKTEAPPVTLPVLGRFSAFTLSDHAGRVWSGDEMLGNIWIVDFICTACPAASGSMSAEMDRVLQSFPPGDRSVRLASISVDPEHDTPKVLAAFSARYKADAARWLFLTGNARIIRKLRKEAPAELRDNGRILVDMDGYFRGAYKGDDPRETDRLLAELATLKRNPNRPVSSGEMR